MQLPAVVLPGLAVVVSPLVSLMQDQAKPNTSCSTTSGILAIVPAAYSLHTLSPSFCHPTLLRKNYYAPCKRGGQLATHKLHSVHASGAYY